MKPKFNINEFEKLKYLNVKYVKVNLNQQKNT